jgi:D-methionine transport system ATP-binding protein
VAEVTRRFVREIVDRNLPPSLVARLGAAPAGPVNPVLRIVFTGPSALQPIVAEAVRRHGVLLNILQATIDEIQGQPYGNVVVEAIGRGQDVQAALEFIRGNQLKVEVIGHVPGDARVAA